MRGAAIGEIVAIHAGDHHVAQLHLGGHARDIGRLSGIEPHVLLRGVPFGTEQNPQPRVQQIAQNHERGRAAMEALVDIRAARRFAHRVQVQRAQIGFQRDAAIRNACALLRAHSGRRGAGGRAESAQGVGHGFYFIQLVKPASSSSRLGLPKLPCLAYGPTSTRVRFFAPGRERSAGKPLLLERLRHGIGRIPGCTRQYLQIHAPVGVSAG